MLIPDLKNLVPLMVARQTRDDTASIAPLDSRG
jgi:hypothetical protein